MCDDFKIWFPGIYFHIILKLGYKVYNHMRTETLTLSHLGCASEVFHDEVVFFT